MKALRTIKLLLAVIIALFAAAAVYISVLIVERQEALRQTSRYNVAWLASQATTEFARLGQRVSAYPMSDGDVDRDEVQLRHDILVNRLKLFEDGDFREFVAADPEHQATVQAFAAALAATQPLIEAIDRPGAVADILAILSPVDGMLARLAAAANRYGGDRAAEDQKELIWLHWLFSSLAGSLILCGIGLIALLIWHNRLLERAHRELHSLAEDLRRTSGDLAVAHAAVQASNAELRVQNGRFDAALNNMTQGLCMVDADQRLIVCNQRYLALFGLSPDVARPGTPIADLFRRIAAAMDRPDAGLERICAEQDMLIRERSPGAYVQEIGGGRTLAVSHQPMGDGGWVATYEDITERRRTEARIAHMAHHDALTDLPNRVLLRQRMEEALARQRRHAEPVSILCLDLDRFKAVNDTLGHPVGDALLRAVADRLRGCLREVDTVARLGGDEFAILQIGCDQPRDSDALARRIVETVSAPYHLDGHEVVIGTSVGIAVAPTDGTSADQLLKNADLALYRAKTDGRGAHRFFESGMDAQLQARRAMEMDLRQALARDEFELHYQPLVNLRTDAIAGCEALLRWRHPERGMVSPAAFIPVAEEIGLITAIGEWVIRQACREAAGWPDAVKVAVNLSPVQFRSRNLVPTVVTALAASGLPVSRLELEITESVLLQDNEATLATLHELRGLGVRIAMDDFGTGYSSLSYLRSFPFDKLKIDQSFVRDLSRRPDCLAIVQSIATLGANLGMATTAEGVETAEQLDQLRLAGCTEAQGYFFDRPKPAGEIVKALRGRAEIGEAA